MGTVVEVDILVVGAGPAGGSLASFLGQNGLKALMISSAPGTADTPRAHVVNPSTVAGLAQFKPVPVRRTAANGDGAAVYQVKSRYIFGCDGGRSTVTRSLEFKFKSAPSGGVACNILLEAYVSDHRMQDRFANLHWIMQPRNRKFGTGPVIRMVKPWYQWMVVCFTPDAVQDPFQGLTPDSPELIQYVKDLFGDPNIDIKILRLDPWTIRESVAEKFSDSYDVFMAPTCVWEAFNLAWKIAYVEKGIAGKRLLDSYNEERWQVGAQLVRESNEGMRRHAAIWASLGMFAESPEAGVQALQELAEVTEVGVARRAQLHASVEGIRLETESLGITRNQVYVSNAIYLDDEGPAPKFDGDPIMDILITSRPGNRLPHAWLGGMVPGKRLSTIDLAGHGAFTLFTGHGGQPWKQVAAHATKVLGVPINCYAIGWGLDYHDMYRDWVKKREIGEDGMLLVRPDRYVAWRSTKLIPDAEEKLLHVLKRILSRDENPKSI
ncbi:hypothetical protein EG329_005532 [Mollisiaceae sp. DMI_Dod_QoI]|nr:hypothetical protein EG329_005532 [Helotiales sp. DMI_Dod_QoI]